MLDLDQCRINLVAKVAYALSRVRAPYALGGVSFLLFVEALFFLSIFFPGPRPLYATGPALA